MTGSPNYDSMMTVHDLIDALYDRVRNRHAKVMLSILTPDGNNPRTPCAPSWP